VLGSAEFSAGPDGLVLSGSVAAKAALEVEASQSIRYGTVGVTSTVSASVYAEAGAYAVAQMNNHGVELGGGAFAGAGVGFEASGTVEAGGVALTGGASATIGLQVGFEGAGHATYEDGIVSFGVTADLAFLLGVKIDMNVTIDVDTVIHSFEDVSEFFTDDVANFFQHDARNFFQQDARNFVQNDVRNFFENNINNVYGNFVGQWTDANGLIDNIGNSLNDFGNDISNGLNDFGNDIGNGLNDVGNDMSNFVNDTGSDIANTMDPNNW
jgi:hypothetical protein